MNPMAYRGPGQTLVGYEPPPAWSPPTPEQESLREPWIDPTTAFAGGFGANIMRRGLMGALRGGTAAAVADYPLGLATAGVEHIDPRLAMPFNLMGGMASGASFERGLENAMAGRAHPVRTARRALGNAMGKWTYGTDPHSNLIEKHGKLARGNARALRCSKKHRRSRNNKRRLNSRPKAATTPRPRPRLFCKNRCFLSA
jgi:hypothetical protein